MTGAILLQIQSSMTHETLGTHRTYYMQLLSTPFWLPSTLLILVIFSQIQLFKLSRLPCH